MTQSTTPQQPVAPATKPQETGTISVEGHIRIFDGRALRAEIIALGFEFQKRHWAHALHSPFWWLKCLWWGSQDESRIIKLYHRMLVWDLMEKPWLTQTLEKILNPIMGKSVVMYFKKADENLTHHLNEGEGAP